MAVARTDVGMRVTGEILIPDRPVGHRFELAGWVLGLDPDEITVGIGDTGSVVTAANCPGAPAGALGWRARPVGPVPRGEHVVVLRDAHDRAVVVGRIEVGCLPGEPPMWLGELESPPADEVVEGDVLHVCGWALLDSRAPSLVEVLVDGAGTTRARTRLPREDVPVVYPAFPETAICGFDTRVPIDVAPGQERRVTVRVRYRTEGVGEHLSEPRTVLVRNPAEDPVEAAPADELVEDTARALARTRVTVDLRHVLVFTHSLGVGGGQLWLRELLEGLVRRHGWRVSLVSETDGPLRGDCRELGVPVHVTTPYRHRTIVEYEDHVGELARFARCSGAGVALVNTLGGFPAADAARRAGLPTAWVIHESFRLPDFAFQNWGALHPPPSVWRRWTRTLAETERLLFVADATREMFLPYSAPERCRTIRYGTPLHAHGGTIDPLTRIRARGVLGIDEDDFLLVNIGIVEPRKGHGPLLSAMERLMPRYPRAQLCVVGWHGSPYGLSLAETVRRAGLTDRVTLVPVVRDPTPWLFAADVFVNSSDIESLPRSILEAVSCGIPIAATDVFGAREMIVDGHSGWLYEPNDVDALTAALVRVLETDPARRRTLAAAAYAGLRDWLDPTLYAHDYSEVLTEIAAGGGTDDWEHR